MRWFSGVRMAVIGLAITAAGHAFAEPQSLHLYNWTVYINPDVLQDFTKETGIAVTLDNYGTNEEMLAKLQAGATGYDIVFPSVFMQNILSKLGYLQDPHLRSITGYSNLDQRYFKATSDPQHEVCMPYNWGSTGLMYNKALTKGVDVTSWKVVFDPPPQLRGKIAMLDDERETLGAALIYNGFSFNSTNPKELAKARDTIKHAKPYWAAMLTDGIGDKVINGDFAIAHWWSGSVAQSVETAPDKVGYVIPKEGANGFQEDMCLLTQSKNTEAAKKFFAYMMRPDVSAKNTNWLHGGSPNKAAFPLISPALRNNPNIYPDAATLSHLSLLSDVGDSVRLWDTAWTQVKASK
ncbi:ABC transporter substrate-binding protein [Paraburkholderia phytofirmans]|nr:spermidine/putrescine ABC transporter substrate-binding protein [Paraburkholderia phytofirmans]